MSISKNKNTTQKNHEADMVNKNPGQDGNNITYDKNQGNRGKQLNPNQKVNGIKKEVEPQKTTVKPKLFVKEKSPNWPTKDPDGGKSGGGRDNNPPKQTPKPTKK